MTELALASTESDAQAAEAVMTHHAAMAGAMAIRTETLLGAAAQGDVGAAERARLELVEWCETTLVPHAKAEEDALYPEAQRTVEGRLLMVGMVAEHEVIGRLLDELAAARSEPVRAAGAARSLQAVFETHLAKENDLVLPLLLSTPGVSLADLLAGMHELLGEVRQEADQEGGCQGHNCTCGEVDGADLPELDARSIPHAVRHAAICGALETVHPGGGLVLVAPHDPLPLLAQVEQRWPGAFTTEYVERGPEVWRLRLVRVPA